MSSRPPLSYIADRARRLVHLKEPLMALQAEESTKYQLQADAGLGDFRVRIYGKELLVVFLTASSRVILRAEAGEVTISESHDDILYEKFLPALEMELVLDELANI